MRRATLLLLVFLIFLPPAQAQLFREKDVRLFPFVVNGNWGFINQIGETKIEPEFKRVFDYAEGVSAVETTDGMMSFIDKDGNFTFPPRKMKLYPLSEGLARASIKGKWGFVNRKGETVIPFKYEFAAPFFNGVARIKHQRKYAFIDRRGLLLTRFYKKAFNFSEGLAVVEISGKRGFIDLFDEIAIQPVFDDSDGFSQGLAAVRMGGKYGFVNRSGEIAIKPKYDNARWFSDGLAPVEISGRWGFIDRDGKFRIDPTFKEVRNFYDGLAAVKFDQEWGYINKKGRIVIAPTFSRAGRFALGIANVERCSKDARTRKVSCRLAYVNKKGDVMWRSQ